MADIQRIKIRFFFKINDNFKERCWNNSGHAIN